MKDIKKMLITSAFPYANGPLHIGHLVEHIKTDIWVRIQRMLGNKCISICGDDAHGTPIMIRSNKLGISPEEMIKNIKISHEKDLKKFSIFYDYYDTTHSKTNEKFVNLFFYKLKKSGNIKKQTILQLYDPIKKMFLPDRYVKGICPICKSKNQYGDNCSHCGSTYSSIDLIDPISVISGIKPIKKKSEHYFFNLTKYQGVLKNWINSINIPKTILNKINEWFVCGLKPWDISRDAPYFGFKIPGENNKYFYVWFDAPIGYMSNFNKYCNNNKLSFYEFWKHDSNIDIYHFIGKDIMYFHILFWPALLISNKYRLPTSIFVHGFLTINGKKMSKSKGTFITANTYCKFLNPEYLRYYFACKLNKKMEDINLDFDDFMNRINSDLIGKLINIASRCSKFIKEYFNNILSDKLDEIDLYYKILNIKNIIINNFLSFHYSYVTRKIIDCANMINKYIDTNTPWILIKEKHNLLQVHKICSTGINLFRILMTYLKPILPCTAKYSESFLNCIFTLDNIEKPLLNHTINNFTPLMLRIDKKNIQEMLTENKNNYGK